MDASTIHVHIYSLGLIGSEQRDGADVWKIHGVPRTPVTVGENAVERLS